MNDLTAILETLLWLAVTGVCYWLALQVFRVSGRNLLFHPIIITVLLVGLVLVLVDQDVAGYQRYVALLNWLLGPATVALAVPMYRQLHVVKTLGWRVVIPILLGGIIAPLLALVAVKLFDPEVSLQMTILAKSITTPLAMDVAEVIGGVPAMAAVIVILTGIVGAIVSPWVFKWLSPSNSVAQGIALGTVAHAVGTARALQINSTTAALASLSLCLNGVFTAIVLPLIFANG